VNKQEAVSITFLRANNSVSQLRFSIHLRQIVFSLNCSICARPADLQTALDDVFTDNANENIFRQLILTYRCELINTVKSTQNSCNHCWKNCYLYVIIHSLRYSKLCPSKNLYVIRNQENLWFCEISLKIILLFCKMKYTVLTGRLHKPPSIHPSIHFVIYFEKSFPLNTENENLVMVSDCFRHESVFVQTFQWYLKKFTEEETTCSRKI
jgi:hypothetical protein